MFNRFFHWNGASFVHDRVDSAVSSSVFGHIIVVFSIVEFMPDSDADVFLRSLTNLSRGYRFVRERYT